MSGSHLSRRGLFAASLLPLAAPAFAQNAAPAWPNRQLRFVVPFTAGGSLDIISRMIAARLPEVIGQGAITENRAGAGTIIGTDAVAKLPADGYSALLVANSFTINATLIPNPPFDARREFRGISFLAYNPHVLIAAPRLNVSTMAEVIAASTARGGLTYASSGIGTSLHLGGVSLRMATGMNLTHVPYRGSGQAIMDVFNGQVDLMLANLADAIPAIREGRVKAIALANDTRQALLPDVPTFDELGIRGVVSNSWFGMIARADVPDAIAQRLHDAVEKIMAEPASVERLTHVGLSRRPMSRAQFDAFLVEEFERNGRVIRQNAITPE